ncbi:hypothetical protein SAMN03097723_3533 [Pantoea eucalypti]|nr:hypothetical protein SAMN03097723_3533 [Pantoea eucalypti]
MNKKLALLFKRERLSLRPWEPTLIEGLNRIAAKCGRDEIAEIHIRLRYLQAEREMTPEWDGDTQDDIWKASHELRQILKLIPKS